MKSYFVYILQCRDDSYYTGITSKLEERIFAHEKGLDKKCYTYLRRPVKLVYYEEFTNAVEALEREKQIKGWTRKKKQALIKGNIKELERLARHSSVDSP